MTTQGFDWALVRSFVAVLDAGSLMGAARRLDAHQPTLSRHIAELEAQAIREALVATGGCNAKKLCTDTELLSNLGSPDDKGKLIKTPSPRERALSRLRTSYPDAAPELERVQAAYNAYAAKRTSLDDPQDLIRMLQGAGVLSFRITVAPNTYPEEQRLRQELREKGPALSRSNEVRWFKINRISSWYESISQLERLNADPAGYRKALVTGLKNEAPF